MSQITTPATIDDAPQASRPILQDVKKAIGSAPNLFRIMANSPAVLEGFFGLKGGLGKGELSEATQERIALAIAEQNGCDYCLAAHTYIGQNVAGLTGAEIETNRRGNSTDAKADAAVRFAAAISKGRGDVDASLIKEVKLAGYSDAEIVEIIGHVALNTMTNYVNKVLETEIDFPVAKALAA